ncbi:MAG: Transcriptional regulatory protein OmpR [Alphaproteobacteria bacterium MarineAlpha9_Bin3]|nr:MAG: Transcriptional regulatory protein OmpR [Alphaproteobacteria bacterium MarineAlpha9_Bin3]|tara:strand:- start:584 stop:1300 length:717 start_codon:yes stop_codon:yes gene_type:complete
MEAKNKNFTAHILVVDDDKRLNKLLEKFLIDNNHYVDTAQNTKSARKKIAVVSYDIIILDIMMPGENGLDFLKYIRQEYNTPVLMLSAMNETKNRIVGFEIGADDYLGKPFEPKELLLRIKAILRRTEENKLASKDSNNLLQLGNILYDAESSIIWKNKKKITLTSKENELLNILINGAGKTIDRYILINNLKLGARGIDITISRLRKKIENNPKVPSYIITVRGEGYTLPRNLLEVK